MRGCKPLLEAAKEQEKLALLVAQLKEHQLKLDEEIKRQAPSRQHLKYVCGLSPPSLSVSHFSPFDCCRPLSALQAAKREADAASANNEYQFKEADGARTRVGNLLETKVCGDEMGWDVM
jgi:hypothetical protein